MTVQPTEDVPRPYADAVMAYIRAGWAGCLPLPLGKKWPPYNGYTGEKGQWPSGADVQAWLDGPEAGGNIALRLPTNVIGLDVDAYHGKQGHQTMADARDRYGDLPRTWRTTSRIDNHSGIYLFRIADETLRWPGQLGTHVEIIQQKHRYAVAPPSLHPEGLPYRWIDPHRNYSIACPRVDDLPYLPDAWVQGITAGQQATDAPRASMDAGTATPWLISRLGDQKAAGCGVTDYAGRQAVLELKAGSRHDAVTRGALRLVRLAADGHVGVFAALDYLRRNFVSEVTTDGSRDDRTAAEEWVRALVSACNVVAANPSDGAGTTDPCDLASLIGTVPQESPVPTPSATPEDQDGSWEGLIPPTGDEAPTPPAGAETPHQDQLLNVDAVRGLPTYSMEMQKAALRDTVRDDLAAMKAARAFTMPTSLPTLADDLALPDEDITYRIGKIMPTDANILLVAQFKAGKTTLIDNLARSLVDGGDFLGHFLLPTLPLTGRVGIFNYEVSEGMYRRWMRDTAIEHTDRISVLNLRGQALPLLAPRVQDEVVRWLVDHDIEVWIIDPYARAYLGTVTNENSNSEVGLFLEIVDIIKARADVKEIVMPAHTGKGIEEGSEISRGATRLEDWADAKWTLTKDENAMRFLAADGRDVEMAESKLTFNPTNRHLTLEGGGDRKWERRRLLQNVIIAAVRETPGIGAKALRDAVGEHGVKARALDIDVVIDGLVGSREITRQEVRDKSGRRIEHHLGNPHD